MAFQRHRKFNIHSYGMAFSTALALIGVVLLIGGTVSPTVLDGKSPEFAVHLETAAPGLLALLLAAFVAYATIRRERSANATITVKMEDIELTLTGVGHQRELFDALPGVVAKMRETGPGQLARQSQPPGVLPTNDESAVRLVAGRDTE